MDNWKFTDEFGDAFPLLRHTILEMLVFSEHDPLPVNFTIGKANFRGTLDVTESGSALRIVNSMLGFAGLDKITLEGNIEITAVSSADTEIAASTITISLHSPTGDDDYYTEAIKTYIPLLGDAVTKAWMDVAVVASNAAWTDGNAATTSQQPTANSTGNHEEEGEEDPVTDMFDLGISLQINDGTVNADGTVWDGTVDIFMQIPMTNGFFQITGNFVNTPIGLDDLGFLMGMENGSWFPSAQLGPYSEGQTSFGLLGLGLTCYVSPDTTSHYKISISSVDAQVGIVKLPLKPSALYMDPLAVWTTVTNPTSSPKAVWGLTGAVKLCNIDKPGPEGLDKPDVEFDFSMRFPKPPTYPTFAISASLENLADVTVNQMLTDLIGSEIDVGVGNVKVVSFDFRTEADVTHGYISDFSTSILMTGGFGLFENISLERISISVDYTANLPPTQPVTTGTGTPTGTAPTGTGSTTGST